MPSVFIFSPLSQFEVLSLIGLNAPILNYLNLSLTNLGLYTILVLFTIVGLHTYGNNDFKLIPNK
jgi:F-type H+-transporting ATPase subunit a